MMKTYNSLLVTMFTFWFSQLFAIQEFDVRFQFDGVDCSANTVCYLVQVRTSDGQTWNLAGQNYRIFYDASQASYISGSLESRLPSAQYSSPLVTGDQQNVDASAFPGDLPFEETLSFLNYSIDLMNLSNGGINLPASGEWVTTSTLCFDVPQSTIDDGSACLNLVWARMGKTDSYATAFVEISQWVSTNSTAEAIGVVYDDLDANDGDGACLSSFCDGGGNENTPATCSDGIDNDNDGLIDCADSSCTMVPPCTPDMNMVNINLALKNVDCQTGMACYNINLTSASSNSFELGDQDYRLYYNSSVGQFASVISRLGNKFRPVSIMGGTPIENQNATGVGPLSFESTLGYVDFSIDLLSATDGSDQIVSSAAATTTAEICFAISDDGINDSNVCFETAWARTSLTGEYNAAVLTLREWIMPSEQRTLTPTNYNDLSSSSGNASCFGSSCAGNNEETGTTQCSDGIDNDNDGLVDCQDPGCSQVQICRDGCAAQAPTLSRN